MDVYRFPDIGPTLEPPYLSFNSREQVELLGLPDDKIRVAEYWTALPSKEILWPTLEPPYLSFT